MSAFIVNPEHVAALAAYTQKAGNFSHAYNMMTKKEIFNGVENFCAVLANANVKSFADKYNKGKVDEADLMFTKECIKELGKFKSLMGCYNKDTLTDADIYNMAQCLEYQCCEVNNWFETDAYWLITKIKGIAAGNMAKQAKVQWNYEAA